MRKYLFAGSLAAQESPEDSVLAVLALPPI